MNCPTCSHTLATIGYCGGGTVYHCERCGTVVHTQSLSGGEPRVYAPKLVGRVRRLRELVLAGVAAGSGRILDSMRTLGIDEATLLPEDRP
jgi:DNA-directed RNA polymerase subunit RPC12/RpoP